eukprot:COSAG02_NODE_8182_length_2673_cov_1.329060_2_plen_262_part_00
MHWVVTTAAGLLTVVSATLSIPVTKPHLHGIFVDFTSVTCGWSEQQWTQDIQAMKDVGMTFFVLHHTATGDNTISSACPAGTYQTYFPMDADPCFRPVRGCSTAAGGAVGVVLRAAAAVGEMTVHLGLAEQEMLGPVVDGKRLNPLYGLHANVTVLQQYRAVQSSIALGLWTQFGATGLISGFYAFLEEPQNFASSLPDWERLATDYFQPLARYIKAKLPRAGSHAASDLAVWSSPDAVGNWTRCKSLAHHILGSCPALHM